MYDNDPNRLNRPPLGEPVDPPSTTSMVIGGIIVAAILALGITFWPTDRAGQTVTQNTPRVERQTTPTPPTTPPANKPITPSAPAPTPPQ
jgi:hypothetical protein